MASRRNAADGRPVARPEGTPQAARLSVTMLGKGATLPCAPCLDPNRLWGSACGFICVGVSRPGKDGQSLANVTRENMLEAFDVNCVSPLKVVRHLRPGLAAARGVVANISSKMGSSGDNASGGAYAYRAAKAGLVIIARAC
ncbi:MAG: SDR family oxidoreductase [Mariprofundaceae bacterium]